MARPRPSFSIAGTQISPGSRQTVELPISVLSDHTPVTMSVHVIHGKSDGPTIFVSAGVHGDEVIGVEIVRRLIRAPNLKSLRGTLIVIPIVNTFGFINHSRYLPDRRDLNRSFPGWRICSFTRSSSVAIWGSTCILPPFTARTFHRSGFRPTTPGPPNWQKCLARL
jgi:predicted deacylase